MRKHLTPEDEDLKTLTDSTLEKLNIMTDAEFDAIDLVPDFS